MKKIFLIFSMILFLNPIISYAKEMEIVTLEECIDGDTAKFKTSTDEIIKARFLAIDTPETKHPTKKEEPYGKKASNYTCNKLSKANEIKIEYDDNSKEEDNYGRKLVWVFVDDVLLQESLVKKGYAEVAYLYGNYKYTNILKAEEEKAKTKKIGIWSIEKEEIKKETTKKKTNKNTKNKSFIERLLDDLVAAITDFIDAILEKLLKTIEDVL